MPARRTPVVLLVVVLAVLVWSAVGASRPLTWVLETIWAIVGLLLLVAVWRRFPLTTLLCFVLAAHAVVLAYGGHTGYSETPLGDAVQDWLGWTATPTTA